MSVIEAIFILIILLGILAGVGAVIYLGFFYKPPQPPAPVLCTNSTCDFTNKCMIQICSDGTRCVSNPFCGSSPLPTCVNFTDLTCNFTDSCMFQVCENGIVRCNPDSRCSPNPNPVTQCSTTDDTIWVNDTCDMTNGCMNQHCSLDPSQKRCKTNNACTNPNPNPAPQWSTYKCMSDASFTKDEIGMCAKASQKCLNTSDCVLQSFSSPSGAQRCSNPTYNFDGCDFNQCNMYRYVNDCGDIVVNNKKPTSNNQTGADCSCSNKWPLDNPNHLVNIGLPTGDTSKPYYYLAMQNNKLSLSNTVNPVYVDHQANGKIYVTYNMNDAFFVKKDLSLSTSESDGVSWYYNSSGLIVDDPTYPTVLWSIDSSNNVVLIPYHKGVENINLDHKNVWRYLTS